jgi:crotonobetainyl-CoA:carnitine CoA-transferase CaiB-like acyl-CoA transferase
MLLNNEQARVNGYLQELDHPTAGRVLVSGTPITYNGEVRTESPPAPEMGQHTEEVLLEFGYSWEEIAALREEGAI